MAGKEAASDSSSGTNGKDSDEPRETVIPETGEYSRVMKEDEYREWVRQTVSGHIWGRMTAIFSAIGFAAVVAMFTYIANVSNSTIEGKIATEKQKLTDEIDKKLPGVINLELSNQIRTNDLLTKITESSVKKINENKGVETALQNLIISQSQKLLRDPSQRSLRAVALQQILLFGDERQKNEAIANIIFDDKSGDQEFALALQNYASHQPESNIDRRRAWHSILDRSASRTPILNAESWRAIDQMLTNEAEVLEACAWVRSVTTPLNQRFGIDSLRFLVQRIAKIGGVSAAQQLILWIESNDQNLREFGLAGLNATSPPDDPTQRLALASRLTRALVTVTLAQDGLPEHLAAIVAAIRQRNKQALRGLGDTEFATRQMKALISQLIAEPENRERWNFAIRNLGTVDAVQNFGRYGQYERNQTAYQLIGKLLDTDDLGDWDKIIKPRIKEADGKWTAPGQANLLVNAWVTVLQRSKSPKSTSVNAAANLFMEAHLQSDPQLFAYNTPSYRYLINRTDDVTFKKFIEQLPAIAGGSDQSSEEAKQNEASILAEALTRLLREESSSDRIKQLRAAFRRDASKSSIERSSAIWFLAARQSTDTNRTRKSDNEILLTLVERIRKNNEPQSAATLLALLTNASFLQLKNVQDAAERANLHLLYEDLGRLKQDPLIGDLAQLIAADAKGAIGWVDSLPQRLAPIGNEPIRLSSDTTWLSIDTPPGQLAELSIIPATEARYTLIGSSTRVSTVQTVSASGRSSEPNRFVVRTEEPGRQFLKVVLLSETEPRPRIAVNFLVSLRAADLPSSKKGGITEIRPGSSVNIESRGNDEAWFRLNAKGNTTYILRTRSLQPSNVDTVIEVYDQNDGQKLKEDDDGGEDTTGSLSSRVVLSPDDDMIYHVRIRNTDQTPGAFIFDALEDRQRSD